MFVLLKKELVLRILLLLTHTHYLVTIQNLLSHPYPQEQEVVVAQDHMLLVQDYHTSRKKLHYRKVQYLQ